MGDELKNDDADYSAYEEEMAKPLTAMEQLVLFVEHDLEAPCLYDLHHEVLQATAELERLRSELKQAREIIKSFHLEYVDYSVLNNLSGHNNHNPRWARRFLGMKEEMSLDEARAFLTVNNDG